MGYDYKANSLPSPRDDLPPVNSKETKKSEQVNYPPANDKEGQVPNQPLSHKKGLVMASLNVNSLLPKIDEIRLLVRNNRIDILVINETKIDDKTEDQLIAIDEYSLKRCDRNRNGGGVALYIHNRVNFKPRDDFPNKSLELICIEVEPPNSLPYIILGWYRPPSDPISCFGSLEENLRYFDRENKEIILLGDTNCDFSNCSTLDANLSNISHLRELYDIFGMSQIINEPTRVTIDTSTLIDHIATTNLINIADSGVYRISLSDHYLVYCVRKLRGGAKREHKYITSRQLKNFNKEAFLSDLSEVDWEGLVSQAQDIEDAVRSWTQIFSLVLEKHAPTLRRRVSDRFSPWLNSDYFKMIKTRDKLKIKAVRNGSKLLMQSYKQIRNKANNLNVRLKREYFSEKITQFQGDLKKTWKTINQVINKKSNTTFVASLNVDNRKILGSTEISSSMNEFFCTIGDKLSKKIPDKPNPLLSDEYFIDRPSTSFTFSSIMIDNLTASLNKMKTSHASGNDGIASYFVKIALPIIKGSLCDLFNLSLFSGKFPDSWKIARVAPIFKSGQRDDRSNYRPISVLPFISRLFEKLLYKQFYDYLNTNKLIYQHQSGFRSLHSVVTCLMANTNDWYLNIDKGKYTGLIFIDLKKAFDTVDHDILLKKLEKYGVSGLEYDWFTSYLNNRKQFCKVNGVSSDIKNINCGVPQGSCLGPLLFLIYINDLPFSLKKGHVSMYADDTTISYSSKNLDVLQHDLNCDLLNLQNWLHGNKLSLNVVKTQSLIIGSGPKIRRIDSQPDTRPSFEIDNENIEIVNNIKYLGVQVDNQLKWDNHIDKVKKKALRALGLVKFSKKYLTTDVLIKMYRGLVEPHLSYCCSVWGNCSKQNIDSLQKVQNRAARIVTNSGFDASAAPIIANLGWPTISNLIQKETATLMYKSLNGIAPDYLQNIFTRCSENNDRALRSTDTNLKLPLSKTSAGLKSFSYRGANLWNSLSRDTKMATSLSTFKRLLKNDII